MGLRGGSATLKYFVLLFTHFFCKDNGSDALSSETFIIQALSLREELLLWDTELPLHLSFLGNF